MDDAVAQPHWLIGLRRAWITSGALTAWVEDRDVTGVIWTPASYETDDLAAPIARLVASGAKPDAALLWDLAIDDIRAAADAVRTVASNDWSSGFVVVWLDPTKADDVTRAKGAAADIAADIQRSNLVVGMTWTPARAAVLEGLIASGMPVALSGVRDDNALREVAGARARGASKLAPPSDDGGAAEADLPVFVLGRNGTEDGLVRGVGVINEFEMFGAAGGPRLPLGVDAEKAGLDAAVQRLAERGGQPERSDAYRPAYFASAVVSECEELEEDGVLEDIWAKDHELWSPSPDEISNRLGWLDIAARMRDEVGDLTDFARKARASADIKHIVLCGMGGSVLAAETFHSTLTGDLPLTVLDTTHPGHIDAVVSSLDLNRTLVVVGSKSGSTIETRAHLEYMWSKIGRGDRFIAVTDPGSELAVTAKERSFARIFENDPNIGGRFSALSYFGLVPAALAGVDVGGVVDGARRAMAAHGPGVRETDAPGVRLGAALGSAVMTEQRDKLTFFLPRRLASLGAWIEQLIAESTGKHGAGILPVVGEAFGGAAVYGRDRVFCSYDLGDDSGHPSLEAIEEDHPVIHIKVGDARSLGAEMYRWEMATAVVGYLLDINPFDQPDVESAKVRARKVLEGGAGATPDAGSAADLLAGVESPRYIAIQAFLEPTEANADRLDAVRTKLRDKYKVATTVGFGPRFLHSTGQLHKGGPATGAFLQVTGERSGDIEVPGLGFTFGRLLDAQADGDLLALRDAGRDAARVSLEALEAMN